MIWMIKYCYEKTTCLFIWKHIAWLGKHSLIILCFHLVELNTIPWNKILGVIGIRSHLFMPTIILKLLWCVIWAWLVDYTVLKKVFYSASIKES